jgi:hypothetical protein
VTIVEFLRARIAEDEAAARESPNRRWLVQDDIITLYPEQEDEGFMSWPTRADARHAARWEPARVLREVAAKQAIIGRFEAAVDLGEPADPHPLRALAAVYADHPDYNRAWGAV